MLFCWFSIFGQTSVSDLQTKFLGTWTEHKTNSISYESWKFENEVLEGSNVSFKNGKKIFEENIRLHKTDDNIYYSVLTPGNGIWVDFKLTSQSPISLKFENPDHDFPKSIVYKWINHDSIVATISDGVKSFDFNYKRSKSVPCNSEEYRQFDFWIGDWDAFNNKGIKVGDSKISASLDGCLILEEWKSTMQSDMRKYEGKSFNNYDRPSGKWYQTWIANHGEAINFLSGNFENNVMSFYSKPYLYARDTMAIRKLSFTRLNNGEVVQRGEILNTDTSKIKTDFEFIYKRKPNDNEKLFEEMLDSMSAKYNKQDFMAVAEMYHNDAEITGGETFVKEKMNIDKYWESLGSDFGGTWKLESIWVKIDQLNKRATQRGKSTIIGEDGKKSQVEFILNWVKTIEGWKIMQDIYW